MIKIKKFLLSLLFIFPSGFLFSQNLSDDFLLVESVPSETSLEQSIVPRTYDVWINLIENATRSIDFEMFYFANKTGSLMEKLFEAIIKAAERGVKIRIIIDSTFYINSEHSVDELLGTKNITIRKIPFGNLGGGVMHAKYFIVDGETLFFGSQNMDWRSLTHIHEIGIKIKNIFLVSAFQKLFNLDWKYCVTSENDFLDSLNNSNETIISSNNSSILTTNYFGSISLYPAFSPCAFTPKDFSNEFEEIIRLIKNSKDRLFIQIYSFYTPSKGKNKIVNVLTEEIKKAAERDVDVRILLPDWAMKKSSVAFIKKLSIVDNIKIKVSSIPLHSDGFIPYARVDHCKYFIADNDISFISTSNWEYGYFFSSRNASLIIKNGKLNSDLHNVFMLSWNSKYAELIDTAKEYAPPKRNYK